MSLGSIFGNIKAGLSGQGRNPFFKGTTTRNRAKQRRGGYAGGWGAIAFGNIVNAHSSAEDIVDEFALDREDARYGTAYADAYQEEYTEAMYQYEEMCEYYFAIIDELTAEYNECIAEAEELRQEAQALREEAETLRDDAEFEEDRDAKQDLLDEAEALEQEADELIEAAEVLEAQAVELQLTIEDLYVEMEMFTVEDFIDYDAVAEKARDYALEQAEQWIAGAEWIPAEVLDWAYYDVSSHNN